jgi:hypothetical protein
MKKKQICEDLYLIMDEDENVKPPSIWNQHQSISLYILSNII